MPISIDLSHALALAGVVVSLLGAAVAATVAMHAIRRQTRLDSFLAFTSRYSAIEEPLIDVLTIHGSKHLANLEKHEAKKALEVTRTYLTLLSQEFYLLSEQALDPDAWY